MSSLNKYLLIVNGWIFSLILLLLAVKVQTYYIVCYYTNWSQYRGGVGQFFPENIDPSLCTHINYAFGKVVGNDIHKIEWNDDAMFSRIMRTKNKNSHLKILLSIGGWNARSNAFSKMVSTQRNIEEFTVNSINFIQQYGFDGLDIDWEYPTVRGGQPGDWLGFIHLLETMRKAYNKENLLLTADVSPNTKMSPAYYEISELGKNLDFINLMAYDMHGSWEQKTGHISPGREIRDSVDFYLKEGVPASKITLGIAAYGRTFTLVDSEVNDLNAPAAGAGIAGEYTRAKGSLAYYEICERLKSEDWHRGWLSEDQVPYAYHGNQWVGFDDPSSVRIKCQYIKARGLLGATLWSLDQDDFMDWCDQGKYPLLRTIYDELNNGILFPTTTLLTPTTLFPESQCYNYQPSPLFCGRLRGMFMYADDCRCYILCDQTYAKVMMCAPTLLYNYVKGQCDLPFLVECYRWPYNK